MKKRYIDHCSRIMIGICIICFCLIIVYIDKLSNTVVFIGLFNSIIWAFNFLIDTIKTEISENNKNSKSV